MIPPQQNATQQKTKNSIQKRKLFNTCNVNSKDQSQKHYGKWKSQAQKATHHKETLRKLENHIYSYQGWEWDGKEYILHLPTMHACQTQPVHLKRVILPV